MSPTNHIRRLALDAALPDLDQALALRSRLEDLARTLMPRVLERVLDAVAPAGRHVRVDRLDLHLGTVAPERLEADALAAFERALTDALAEALARAAAGSADGPERSLSPAQARMELAESFLTRGLFPFWAGADAPDPAVLLRELAVEQPAAMAALLRRRGGERVVLERLVLQMGEDGLRRLLAALAPADAAVILAYLADLNLLHREQPLMPLTVPAAERLFWMLTFDYLVREAGSQFNRRSFLRSLLVGAADREGLDYAVLLTLLREAVERTLRRRPLGSSLPAVLRELLDEEPVADAPDGEVAADGPGPPSSIPFAAGPAAGDPAAMPSTVAMAEDEEEALLALLRRNLRNRAALTALVARLSPALFARLVERLEPAHAALMLAFLADLARLHREEALLLLSAEGFARLTQVLTLLHLLRDPGTQFNRRSWLRAVLEGMAAEEGVSYEGMLAVLVRAVALTAGRRPAATALPGLIAELADEAVTVSALPLREVPRARWDGRRLDRRARIRHWLDHGAAPWWAPEPRSLKRSVAALPDLPLADLLAVFDSPDPERNAARLRRAMAALDRDRGLLLLRRLAPRAFAPGGPLAAYRSARTPASPSEAEERARQEAMLATVAALLSGQSPAPRPSAPAHTPPAEPPALPPPPPPGAAAVEHAALLAWLAGDGAEEPPWGDDRLARALADLLDSGRDDEALDAVLRAGLGRPDVRARWIARLPDTVLGRLLHRIEPALAGFLIEAVALLSAAWRQATPAERNGGTEGGGIPWAALLARLAATPPKRRSARALIRELVRDLTGNDPEREEPLLERARFLAGEAGHAPLLAALSPAPHAPAAAPSRPAPPPTGAPARKPPRPAPGSGDVPPSASGEPIYVGNAGLVLLNPYLPALFDRLGVLTVGEDGVARVTGLEATSRAVHLLQYLADGRCDRPEPTLVLNKLLCGLDPAIPVEPAIQPTDEQLGLCDGLLGAVIGNWPIIRNTSVAGLRETFLAREGRLERGADRWTLTVQRRTVDVLVDQVPWSFAVLYHSWMRAPLHVSW
ncbi:contractile injection system tape measure protein [Azospirillum sp. sgz302134]